MKKYIFAAVFSLALLASPAFTQAASLTSEQIQSILSLLSSFGADNTIVTNVKAALIGGTPAPASTTVSPSFMGGGQSGTNKLRVCNVLHRNLSQGAQGDDVRSLQEFLGEEGHFSTSSATGYFGPMTAQAVAKWQVAQGVQGIGSVGPMTRERIKMWCGKVSPKMPVSCPDIFMPVCGQWQPSCPTGVNCPASDPAPKTYSNSCELAAAGATFLYKGECSNDSSTASSTVQSN